tara:strand:- start:1466 stop:2518 length:1053 start_codon:yes stop_codon:yes gene_type:complete
MSSLFEKAIADAKELKETAIKNAEHLIIEKYSSELKETIESLLEQEEEIDIPVEDGDEEEIAIDMAAEEPAADSEEELDVVMAQIPDAATQALAAALVDGEEEVVIDFDELMTDYESSTPEEEAEEVPEEEEAAIDRDELTDEEEDLTSMIESLSEEELTSLLEEVDVDIKSIYPSNGWAGSTTSDKAENVDLVALGVALEEELASEKEKNEKLTDANVQLTETLQNTNEQLTKAKAVLKEMQGNITEVNLRNAKLYYTTKVLETQELNTRQKNRIVESLAKAKTTEETKLVYETLKESVGSTKETAPKSLVETVNRTRSLVLASQKREEKKEALPMYDHWKKLAGINKP